MGGVIRPYNLEAEIEATIKRLERRCIEAGAKTAMQVLAGKQAEERNRIYTYQDMHPAPSEREIAKHHRSCNLRKKGGGCSC